MEEKTLTDLGREYLSICLEDDELAHASSKIFYKSSSNSYTGRSGKSSDKYDSFGSPSSGWQPPSPITKKGTGSSAGYWYKGYRIAGPFEGIYAAEKRAYQFERVLAQRNVNIQNMQAMKRKTPTDWRKEKI